MAAGDAVRAIYDETRQQVCAMEAAVAVAVAKANEATSVIAHQIAETIPAIATESDARMASARAFATCLGEDAAHLERTYADAMGGALRALNTTNDAAKKTIDRAQEVLSHLQFQDMLSQALLCGRWTT